MKGEYCLLGELIERLPHDIKKSLSRVKRLPQNIKRNILHPTNIPKREWRELTPIGPVRVESCNMDTAWAGQMDGWQGLRTNVLWLKLLLPPSMSVCSVCYTMTSPIYYLLPLFLQLYCYYYIIFNITFSIV